MATLPVRGAEPKLVEPDAGDTRLWSVTTLIGALDKPALVPWAAKETAKAAIDDQKVWMSRLQHEGRDSAIKYLTDARWRSGKGQRSATELGTAVHKAAETKALDGEFTAEQRRDAELLPFLGQIDRMLEEFAPRYLAAELTVFNETFAYAGTCDGIVEMSGVTVAIDYKTSRDDYDYRGALKKPYPEGALQLAAYRYAEFAAVWRARQAEAFKRRYYLLNATERALAVPIPPTDGGVLILITPTRYAVHPVRCGPEVFEFFLHTVEAARWVFEDATTAVGAPMIPPHAFEPDDSDPFAGLPT